MHHRDIEERIATYLLGDLGAAEAEQVRRHLEGCAGCRALAQELELTLDLVRGALAADAAAPAALSPERRRRVLSAREESARGGRAVWLRPWIWQAAGLAAMVVVLACLLMPSFQTAGTHMAKLDAEHGRSLDEVLPGQHGTQPASPAPASGPTGAPEEPASRRWTERYDVGLNEEEGGSAERRPEPAFRGRTRVSAGEESLGLGTELSTPWGDRDGDVEVSEDEAAAEGVATYAYRESLSERSGGDVVVGFTMEQPPAAPATAPTRTAVELGEGPEARPESIAPMRRAAPALGQTLAENDYVETLARKLSASPVAAEPAALVLEERTREEPLFVRFGTTEIAEQAMDAEAPTSGNNVAMNHFYADVERWNRGGGGLPALSTSAPADQSGVVRGVESVNGDVAGGSFVGGRAVMLADSGVREGEDVLSRESKRVEEEVQDWEFSSEALAAGVRVAGGEAQRRLDPVEDRLSTIEDARGEAVASLGKDATLASATELSLLASDVTADKPVLGDRPTLGALMPAPARPAAEPEPDPGLVTRAYGVNPFVPTAHLSVSTFAIDVDTASYTLARRYLHNGQLPPPEAVRTEEFVNFFDYGYSPPRRGVFAVYTTLAPTPFGDGRLLQIGVQGRRLGREEERAAVLTFVIDTSGSMDTPDRWGLVRESMRLLLDGLRAEDRVAIVQVDSQARLLLPHTPAGERDRITSVLDGMQCSGSTHLEQGIRLGYQVAADGFTGGAVNRVILLSDGAANLGSTSPEDILAMVETHRAQGIDCSVFGFGIGTYNDALLEQLANRGDGVYHFVDSVEESRRLFVDELAGTLQMIASDVKIQVEFDPARVFSYRQLGYENRQLTREQFRDDTVDAGEVGSGQSVTALYEIVPVVGADAPIGEVRIRYRDRVSGEVEEYAYPIAPGGEAASFEAAGPPFRLAAATAEFAEILRGSPFAEDGSLQAVADALRPVAMELHLDTRVQELLQLVQRANALSR